MLASVYSTLLPKPTSVNFVQDSFCIRATIACLIVITQLCASFHYSNSTRARGNGLLYSSASQLHRFNEKTPLTENSSSEVDLVNLIQELTVSSDVSTALHACQ